jgi:hypothetical protein
MKCNLMIAKLDWHGPVDRICTLEIFQIFIVVHSSIVRFTIEKTGRDGLILISLPVSLYKNIRYFFTAAQALGTSPAAPHEAPLPA